MLLLVLGQAVGTYIMDDICGIEHTADVMGILML
jgi:hypothetical protein